MRLNILVALLWFLAGCRIDGVIIGKNDRGCYYAMYKYKSADKDSVTIYGKIRSEEFDYPAAVLFVRDSMYIIDKPGGYKIRLKPGKYTVTASTMSDNTMMLKSLNLHPGDSVRVDFFLTQNTDPHMSMMWPKFQSGLAPQ